MFLHSFGNHLLSYTARILNFTSVTQHHRETHRQTWIEHQAPIITKCNVFHLPVLVQVVLLLLLYRQPCLTGFALPLPSSPFFSLSSPFLDCVNKFDLLRLFLKHKTYKFLEPRNILYICIVYIIERVKISSIIPLSVLYSVCGRK